MSLFICDICDSKFEFKYEIIVHLKDHQNGSIKTTNRNSSTNAGMYYVCSLVRTLKWELILHYQNDS